MMKSLRLAFNCQSWAPSAEQWKACLSSVQHEEASRISEFMFKKSAKLSMAGRLMLRHWACMATGAGWRDVRFARTEKGRPYLLPLPNSCDALGDVNVSHQGDWVVLAATPLAKIGVDVMKVEYKGGKSISEFFRLMRRQFTDAEWRAIQSCGDESEQLFSFYRHWCLKEAVVKALGVGIGFNLQKVSFTISSPCSLHETTTNTTVTIDGCQDSRWRFEETKLDDAHCVVVATLAEKGECSLQPEKFAEITISELLERAESMHEVSDSVVEGFINREEGHWL